MQLPFALPVCLLLWNSIDMLEFAGVAHTHWPVCVNPCTENLRCFSLASSCHASNCMPWARMMRDSGRLAQTQVQVQVRNITANADQMKCSLPRTRDAGARGMHFARPACAAAKNVRVRARESAAARRPRW